MISLGGDPLQGLLSAALFFLLYLIVKSSDLF